MSTLYNTNPTLTQRSLSTLKRLVVDIENTTTIFGEQFEVVRMCAGCSSEIIAVNPDDNELIYDSLKGVYELLSEELLNVAPHKRLFTDHVKELKEICEECKIFLQ